MKTPRTSSANLWESEYENQGIPSSFRESPSGSVVDFMNFTKEQRQADGWALDIGCGTGRNTKFLSECGYSVVGVDYARSMVEQFGHSSKELMKSSCVLPLLHDINTPWPFASDFFDLAVDVFCFKHQIEEDYVSLYVAEVSRVVRPGGMFLLSLAGIDDGYYKQFLDFTINKKRNVIVDPGNGIRSVLYDRATIVDVFKNGWKLCHFSEKRKDSEMHGNIYPRSTLMFYFQRTGESHVL